MNIEFSSAKRPRNNTIDICVEIVGEPRECISDTCHFVVVER